MARRKHRFRSRETGARLLVLGSGLLLVPVLVQAPDPVLGAATQALRTPGWVSVTAGALMLGWHRLPGRGTWRRPRRHRIAIWESKREGTHRGREAPPYPQPAAASTPTLALPTEWSPRVFELIEWHRFEAVCEALFAQAGFQTRRHLHRIDSSVDIWLYAAGVDKPVAVVQCKHWRRRPIPVERVRAFFGVMAAHEIKRGTFATSSAFTPDALAFGRAHGINLQDGAGLIRLIQSRSPEQQAALLALALEGDFWKPSCPSCGVKLTERGVQKAKSRFWGCPNYPACRFALPVTETEAAFLRSTRQGQGGPGNTTAEPARAGGSSYSVACPTPR